MTSKPSQLNSFSLRTFSGLTNLTSSIVGAVCIDPNPCSSNPCVNGGTCQPSINTYQCLCPKGQIGAKCGLSCSPKDVTFILDMSRSIDHKQFQKLLTFLSKLVEKLEVGVDGMQISMVTYSDHAHVVFGLQRYTEKKEVMHSILNSGYIPGAANTADALDYTAEYVFKEEYGDRSWAENIAILITDGESNIDRHLTVPAAEKLRATGTTVLGVGIRLENTDELHAIVGDKSNIFEVSRLRRLPALTGRLIPRLCKSSVHLTTTTTATASSTDSSPSSEFSGVEYYEDYYQDYED
ncbi:von Willebrand factor A domain-containing protein 2-like [Liolophura sinensis]|uniref:von Willebrand factor A domain-containing protein 2-like n=1 Tax=Liolophura sinensis TaxID=3198878 RepID=UPI00315878A0